MTLVVADTSPLNYLVLIGGIELLPRLYGVVLIPTEVKAELTDAAAPAPVAVWLNSKPEWLLIQSLPVNMVDPSLDYLDAGERAAILLAGASGDAMLLMDDSAGRNEAGRRNIPTTGTLGVLREAAARGWIDLPSSLVRLAKTNFRVSASLISDLLAEHESTRERPEPPA